jgi:hypothetical protein
MGIGMENEGTMKIVSLVIGSGRVIQRMDE